MTAFDNIEWMAKKAVKSKAFSKSILQILPERLDKELSVVRRENCAEMFVLATTLFAKARNARYFIELSPASGNSLSLLCYLLNISMDNPLLYPEYDSFAEFERKLATNKLITILVSGSGMNEMKSYIKNAYPETRFKEQPESFDALIPATNDYTEFSIHATLDYESARRERVLDSIVSLQLNRLNLNRIPLNDEEAYKLFNNLDWDGVTDNLVFTKVMSEVREKQPHSIQSIWGCINTPVYQVFGTREDEQINLEPFSKAVRIYQLAYLKAHFKTEFDVTLETERIRYYEPN